MRERSWRNITLVCFVIILIGGTLANARLWQAKTRGEDVYYAWVEGQRLIKGKNPYARALDLLRDRPPERIPILSRTEPQ